MPHLTKEQLRELKGLLLEEKEGLTAHYEQNDKQDAEFDDSLTTSTGELSAYDNHPADLGTETYERERDLAIDASFGDKLEEVNRALEELDNGAYGKCDVCGEDISFERLQALPWTTRCIDHAEGSGTAGDGPAAEQAATMQSSGADEKRRGQAEKFDDAGAWEAVTYYGNASDTVKPDA